MKHDILVRMSQFNTSGEELKGLRKLFTDIKLRKTDERPVICEKSILLYYLNHDTATNTRDDALGGLADRRQFGLSEYGTFWIRRTKDVLRHDFLSIYLFRFCVGRMGNMKRTKVNSI